MKQYRISALRIGSVLVWAENVQEAKEKVQRLSMDRFHWLSKEDGNPADYLITGVEECGKNEHLS